MQRYIYAPGGEPVGNVQPLPSVWQAPTGQTIVGMRGLSDAELAAWGWHPVAVADIGPNQRHGVLTKSGDGWTIPAVDMTAAEMYQRDLQACYEARRAAYGPVETQLDMQFHGLWESHISRVKALYPKPVPPT